MPHVKYNIFLTQNIVEKIITMYLNRTNRSLLSITCALNVPHKYFWRGLPAQVKA